MSKPHSTVSAYGAKTTSLDCFVSETVLLLHEDHYVSLLICLFGIGFHCFVLRFVFCL